jgi:hypothetical protein
MIFVYGDLIAMFYSILQKALVHLDGIKHECEIMLSCSESEREMQQ